MNRDNRPVPGCWLCGQHVTGGTGGPDPHMGSQPLCRACHRQQPRASSRRARAAAALAGALHITAPSPYQQATLARVASRYGIVAWCDSGHPAAAVRYAHLLPARLAAARTAYRHAAAEQLRRARQRPGPGPTIRRINATGRTDLAGWWGGARWAAP